VKNYCVCWFRRTERAFLLRGVVCCSSCEKPVCCDAVALDAGVEHHHAETINEEQFICWEHRYSITALDVSHSESSRATSLGPRPNGVSESAWSVSDRDT